MTVRLVKETYVNVYEVDMAYGGPEEGGWYFDTGTALESHHVAADAVEDVRKQLRDRYQDTGMASNVNYNGGEFGVWHEDKPAADFPTESPFYE